MKAFRNPFLLVVLFCSLFLVKCTCGPEEEDTLIKQIATNWKISTLTVGGNAITTGTEAFELSLKESGDKPTTFTITTGGLAYNFASATSGSWTVNDVKNPTQATFASKTVDFTASKTQLRIQYKTDKAVDKNEPVVVFVLVPKI